MRLSLIWRRVAFALGIFMATSGLLAACSSGGGGDGSDEDYVKSICEANLLLEDVIGILFESAFSGEEPDEDALDELVESFEKWIDALDDANPPSDAADAHDALVERIREGLDELKSGDADLETLSLFGDEEDLPEPPQAVRDRLNEAAAGVEVCEGTELFG